METMTEPRLRVLILGTGAREHALARKLSNEPKVERIIILPGNAGIRDKARKISSTLEVVKINPENGFRELIAWAKDMRIDLVIPGHQRWKFPMLGEDFSKGK